MIFRKSALDRLSSPEQLDSLLYITNPRSWLAFAALAALIGAALLWATTTSIPLRMTAPAVVLVDGEGERATARFFVSIEQSRQLAAGVPVTLSSLTGAPQQVRSRITAVGAAPATPEQLAATPSHDFLLANIPAATGGPIAVDIALPATPGSFDNGALATATITLGHIRPIELIIPLN